MRVKEYAGGAGKVPPVYLGERYGKVICLGADL